MLRLPNGYFARLLAIHPIHSPGVINTDQARLYGAAIPAVKEEGILRRRCRHRPVQYLNNILEQGHRAIKRPVKAKQNFREFQAARRAIDGYEAIHRIRKGQARWISGKDIRSDSRSPIGTLELRHTDEASGETNAGSI
jgi:transposase-like protein